MFSSPTIAKRTDSGENHINKNKARTTRSEVPTKEDEIHANVVVSNKTMDLAICQDPKQVIGPEQFFDIGDILKGNSINNLTDHQKYMIYKNHFVRDSSYLFPKSFQHECNRSCKPNYISSSFAYSKNDDAVFCLYCSLFVIVIQDPNCHLL